MSKGPLLDANDVMSCPHRVALDRGGPQTAAPFVATVSIERRRREAVAQRDSVRALWENSLDLVAPRGASDTMAALERGAELVWQPTLPDDLVSGRRTRLDALIRVGREGTFRYAPLVVKNHELTTAASTRRILSSSLDKPRPADATWVGGVGIRRATASIKKDFAALYQAAHHLKNLGHAGHPAFGGIVDRSQNLWWFELAHVEGPLSWRDFDARFAQRRDVLQRRDAWELDGSPFPTTPFWHKECDECAYAAGCRGILEERNDVSLVRSSSFDEQVLLREAGIATRHDLAQLNPELARRSRQIIMDPAAPLDPSVVLGRGVDQLDELIYRARVFTAGTFLRKVDISHVACPTGDVEIDVDMESYDDVTYLWGARVRAPGVEGVSEGYVSFGHFTANLAPQEGSIFDEFWSWFEQIRKWCSTRGLQFRAYCFFASAENGAMRQALDRGASSSRDDVESFIASPDWVDLHEIVKRVIQTDGPLGLKVVAPAAGFNWRDDDPGGENSMAWFEEALAGDVSSRQRILDYNEDDCAATAALRDWLNGAARQLPHRDDPDGPWTRA